MHMHGACTCTAHAHGVHGRVHGASACGVCTAHLHAAHLYAAHARRICTRRVQAFCDLLDCFDATLLVAVLEALDAVLGAAAAAEAAAVAPGENPCASMAPKCGQARRPGGGSAGRAAYRPRRPRLLPTVSQTAAQRTFALGLAL